MDEGLTDASYRGPFRSPPTMYEVWKRLKTVKGLAPVGGGTNWERQLGRDKVRKSAHATFVPNASKELHQFQTAPLGFSWSQNVKLRSEKQI